MNKEKLIKLAKQICEIELNDAQAVQFELYADKLIETNKVMNLTAIDDDEGVIYRHFIDSMTIFNTGLIKGRIIDIGTGAGFPGMVMKLVTPELDVTLLDSLQKRLTFLSSVASECNINVRLEHGRAEDYAHNNEFRGVYDIATARAVARLAVLTEYCLPFVKNGGYFISIKGPKATEELDEAKNAISKLGGKLIDVLQVKIPVIETENNIIIIKKISTTSFKYPRKTALIKQHAL